MSTKLNADKSFQIEKKVIEVIARPNYNEKGPNKFVCNLIKTLPEPAGFGAGLPSGQGSFRQKCKEDLLYLTYI